MLQFSFVCPPRTGKGCVDGGTCQGHTEAAPWRVVTMTTGLLTLSPVLLIMTSVCAMETLSVLSMCGNVDLFSLCCFLNNQEQILIIYHL